jgi:hypothetical protein
MPTERQIAANRRNAAKSAGPSSKAGKRRASGNSFQHGLSKPAALGSSDQDWIERFARAATKGRRTVVTLELARSATCAHLDLLRIRKVRAASIQHLSINLEKWLSTVSTNIDQKRNMTHIALLRLNRIDRYERRAAWRKDKALRAIGLVDPGHEKALDDRTRKRALR